MNIKDVIKNIPAGTFNYKSYKSKYRCKFNRDIDIFLKYIAQLPYLKVITYPMVMIFIMMSYLPIVVLILAEYHFNKLKSKKR